MLAIQSSIVKHHCLYTQGAVASQMAVFFTHPVLFYLLAMNSKSVSFQIPTLNSDQFNINGMKQTSIPIQSYDINSEDNTIFRR